MSYKLIKLKKKDKLSYDLPIEIEDYEYLLIINKKKYPVYDTYNLKEFKNENIITVHYWSKVAFINAISGELLLFTGIEDTFVGVEILNYQYLIVSDTALIMFNKQYYYPTYYAKLSDYVLDYEVLNDNKIKLKFAVDGELIFDF